MVEFRDVVKKYTDPGEALGRDPDTGDVTGLEPGTDVDPVEVVTDPAAQAALSATFPQIDTGEEQVRVHWRSTPDPGGDPDVVTEDAMSRLTIESYQPGGFQLGDGQSGEGIRLDLMNNVAKNMLAWRLPFDPEQPFDPDTNPMRTVVWAGAHWDSIPGGVHPLHAHWSVEVPNDDGQLETRFQIKFVNPATNEIGSDKAQIIVSQADFCFGAGPAGANGNTQGTPVFRMGGAKDTTEKIIEWSISSSASFDPTKVRWQTAVNAREETGSDAGSDFVIRRFSDTGEYLGAPFWIERKTGRIGLSTASTQPTALGQGRLTVRFDPASTDTRFGLWLVPTEATGSGAAIMARMTAVTDHVLRSLVGSETNYRFQAQANGTFHWGGGSAAPDVSLYRDSAGTLRTDGSIRADRDLRINTGSVGGGVGVLAIANAATVPSFNPTGGGVLYVEDGALCYRGPAGTVTTLANA